MRLCAFWDDNHLQSRLRFECELGWNKAARCYQRRGDMVRVIVVPAKWQHPSYMCSESSVVPTRVKLNVFLGLFSDSDFMGHSDSLYWYKSVKSKGQVKRGHWMGPCDVWVEDRSATQDSSCGKARIPRLNHMAVSTSSTNGANSSLSKVQATSPACTDGLGCTELPFFVIRAHWAQLWSTHGHTDNRDRSLPHGAQWDVS